MRVFILATFLLVCQTAFSQNLVGTWRGNYAYNHPYSDVAIALQITLNPDSSLNIQSYTLFKQSGERDLIVVCKVKVLRNKENILELEEFNPTGSNREGHQIMRLAYKKKKDFEYLEGTWHNANDAPFAEGRMRFVKLKNP